MKRYLIIYENLMQRVFKTIEYYESKQVAIKQFKEENPMYNVIAIRQLKGSVLDPFDEKEIYL